jgi:dihydrofolate reductase
MENLPEIVEKLPRKLILYIATSLDGYIARLNGDLDWLDIVQVEGEDYGYQHFVESVDTVIVGRKSYDKVMTLVDEFPHKDKKCYILTRSERESSEANLVFYNKSLEMLLETLRQEGGAHIYCDGGAEVVTELMRLDAIDEYIISIIPIFLGDGIRLFKANRPEMHLQLIDATAFSTGLVQLQYARKREH